MKANEARLATLEAFFKLAAENPKVDFSVAEEEDDGENFDPIRDIEVDADPEMNRLARKWAANPSY